MPLAQLPGQGRRDRRGRLFFAAEIASSGRGLSSALATLGLACLVFRGAALADPPPEIFKRVSPSVAFVLSLGTQNEPLSFGSGLILTANGLLATNYHVIERADRVAIKLPSGIIFTETALVYSDRKRDLAILFVPGQDLPAAKLGDSDRIQVGEDVLAIGNPQGLENTLTRGIVSGIRQEGTLRYIQTTVPLSPGSSGGPVINMRGEVIGLAIGTLPDSQNLNFAMPINDVRLALKTALAKIGSVERLAREKALEEAARRRAQDEEKRRKAAEEAATRKAAEEARRKAAEAEAAKKAAEEEARRGAEAEASIRLDAADFPFRWYLRLVQQKISERWVPQKPNLTGGRTVVVRFEIDRNGEIKDLELERPSGNFFYDQAALRAVKEASPFPPLPAEYRKPSLRVSFGFEFMGEGGVLPAKPDLVARETELLQTAYIDHTRGNYALAIAGFQEFLRLVPDSDLADDAQYYIGEARFSLAHEAAAKGEAGQARQEYERAAQEFRQVLIKYPQGNKTPTALYKEGLTQLELGNQTLAEARFQYLVDNFPGTPEALKAKDDLARLKSRKP